MITSPKAKAIIAAILTIIVGVLGQVIAANVVTGSALHWTQVALAVVTALGTTLGVYLQPNAEA